MNKIPSNLIYSLLGHGDVVVYWSSLTSYILFCWLLASSVAFSSQRDALIQVNDGLWTPVHGCCYPTQLETKFK